MPPENAVTEFCALVDILTGHPLSVTSVGCKPCRILKNWECIREQITSGWKNTVFSDRSDASVRRYFSFHLEVIRRLSDNLFKLQREFPGESCYYELQQSVLSLLDYLISFFPVHFDKSINAPIAFCKAFVNDLKAQAGELYAHIDDTEPDNLLYQPVKGYLLQMISDSDHCSYTFHDLFYFKRFVANLLHHFTAGAKAPLDLLGQLIAMNFNHLQVFTAAAALWTDNLPERDLPEDRLAALFALKSRFGPAIANTASYSAEWPSLVVMLSGWLGEEIAASETYLILSSKAVQPVTTLNKLTLDLSVAHLAAVLRVMVQEGLFKAAALADIFRFAASHLRTRRQEVISAGSLSKEYYSVSQVTAAKVRDRLLKMTSRIDHDFFPAFFGASLLIHAFLKSC